MIVELSHTEQAYAHARKAVEHYQRLLLEGGMDAELQRFFRRQLVRAVFARGQARRAIEQEENDYEVVGR